MQIIKIFLLLLIATLGNEANAQIHQARGQYELSYRESIGTFDKKEAPLRIKEQAQQEAALKAVQAYYAEAGQAESTNFDVIRSKILQDRGRYIMDVTVISENDNQKDCKYSVVVRVSLNVANLRNTMQSSSAVGRATANEKSMLSFVFVSRQVLSEKTYNDRVYTRAEAGAALTGSANRQQTSSTKEKTSEGESIKKSQVDTFGSKVQQRDESINVDASKKTVVTTETGGSTLRSASETSYKLMPSQNLDQVFTSTFAQAGYDVVDAAQLESDKFKIADIQDDYRLGNDLQAKTLRSIVNGMKEASVPYVALGTLDVGLPGKDPQTGLTRVDVTVNAKVWDVTRFPARTKAAVGPVVYAGVGNNEDVARLNALKSAASSAAQELSSRMSTLSIR